VLEDVVLKVVTIVLFAVIVKLATVLIAMLDLAIHSDLDVTTAFRAPVGVMTGGRLDGTGMATVVNNSSVQVLTDTVASGPMVTGTSTR
jgi:hypothetical protein